MRAEASAALISLRMPSQSSCVCLATLGMALRLGLSPVPPLPLPEVAPLSAPQIFEPSMARSAVGMPGRRFCISSGNGLSCTGDFTASFVARLQASWMLLPPQMSVDVDGSSVFIVTPGSTDDTFWAMSSDALAEAILSICPERLLSDDQSSDCFSRDHTCLAVPRGLFCPYCWQMKHMFSEYGLQAAQAICPVASMTMLADSTDNRGAMIAPLIVLLVAIELAARVWSVPSLVAP